MSALGPITAVEVVELEGQETIPSGHPALYVSMCQRISKRGDLFCDGLVGDSRTHRSSRGTL